jgi:hypothetical protein
VNRNPDVDRWFGQPDLEAVIRAWCDWKASPSKPGRAGA